MHILLEDIELCQQYWEILDNSRIEDDISIRLTTLHILEILLDRKEKRSLFLLILWFNLEKALRLISLFVQDEEIEVRKFVSFNLVIYDNAFYRLPNC